jgi:hypothetical protein
LASFSALGLGLKLVVKKGFSDRETFPVQALTGLDEFPAEWLPQRMNLKMAKSSKSLSWT